MNIPSLTEISNKAQGAIQRFPITLLWAILGTFYCIFLVENTKYDFFDNDFDAILTIIVGISWLIGIQFFIEQLKNQKKWQWLKLLLLILLGLFYWYLPSIQYYDENPIYLFRFFLYLIAGHLFMLFAPFILNWDKNAYWNYLRIIATAIIRSLFFSGILYIGLILALAAIDALFDVTIPGKRYGQLFIFSLGIVNTWIYLSDFPKIILQNTTINFQKALEVLVKYILIPLILLYLIILYAYSIKILFNWELPKGWVSYLVIVLSFLGYSIQVIINPIQKTLKSWTINKFYPWFYFLLIPLNILLFVAILRRINDYGITENRYFVFAIALWNVAIIAYLLISKKKALKVIPATLFLIAIFSSFGFWSAFSISKNSQIQQFTEIFNAVKLKDNLATEDEFDRLKSILHYLEKRKTVSSLDEITKLKLESFRDSIKSERQAYGWLNQQKIWDSLAIKLDSTSVSLQNNYPNYYNYYNDWNKSYHANISEFDNFTYLQFSSSSIEKINIDTLYMSYNNTNQSIAIFSKNNDSLLLEIPLLEKLKELQKYGTNLNKVSQNELTIETKSTVISSKLIFSELAFQKENKNDSLYLNQAKVFLFLKQN